jgi:hypothetical protein
MIIRNFKAAAQRKEKKKKKRKEEEKRRKEEGQDTKKGPAHQPAHISFLVTYLFPQLSPVPIDKHSVSAATAPLCAGLFSPSLPLPFSICAAAARNHSSLHLPLPVLTAGAAPFQILSSRLYIAD